MLIIERSVRALSGVISQFPSLPITPPEEADDQAPRDQARQPLNEINEDYRVSPVMIASCTRGVSLIRLMMQLTNTDRRRVVHEDVFRYSRSPERPRQRGLLEVSLGNELLPAE